MVLVLWRPRGINEAIPATFGAFLIFLSGTVTLSDLADIGSKISGAAITILATMVMAISLESFGFFHWMAAKIHQLARGSGKRLFWLTILLCFLMTMLFNNDGSIMITTPILLFLLNRLKIKPLQKLPYLISGALIATASSVPIGVSNIVNLIALKIIGMTLYQNTIMIFVPGVLGLLFLSAMLYLVFLKELPETIPLGTKDGFYGSNRVHPLQTKLETVDIQKKTKLMIKVFSFVFIVRASLFAASYFGLPVPMVAVFGSLILLVWRWIHLKLTPVDVLKKTPWHIFIFAFNMYVIIYGLRNIGLTNLLVYYLEPIVEDGVFHASFIMGTLLTLLSNIFNNHPALMVGTISLTQMHLSPLMLKAIYLSNIIGSDIGSLLLPIGTLATLIWMHILKQNHVKITWKQYVRITFLVIPPTVFFTLFCLYLWLRLLFHAG